MNWILKNARYDLWLILFPGFLILPFIPFMSDRESLAFLIIGFFAFAIVDSGHVYTTAWRVATEKGIYAKLITYLVPISVFALFFCWYYFKIPYLWSFVVYVTFFHHIRQFYGVSRMYQRLNKSFSVISDYFLYSLMVLPLVMLHFTSGIEFTYYTNQDILYYPSPVILYTLLTFYGLIMLTWFSWEANRFFKQQKKELNRFLSVLCPVALYFVAMIGSRDYQEAAFLPLLVAHGIPYMAIISWRLDKQQKQKLKKYGVIFGLVLCSAIALGTTEVIVQEGFIDISYSYLSQAPDIFWATIIGLYLTPLFSHYLWDGYIWTRQYMK